MQTLDTIDEMKAERDRLNSTIRRLMWQFIEANSPEEDLDILSQVHDLRMQIVILQKEIVRRVSMNLS